jgi:hypothetical protein
MPLRYFVHLADTALVTALLASVTSAAGAAISVSDPAAAHSELILLLLPLIGAMIASAGAVLLNPAPEVRRIVAGRSLFALMAGALGPSVVTWIHPALADFAARPAFLLLMGGAVSVVVYILSKPFLAELYARSASIAKAQAEQFQKDLIASIPAISATVVPPGSVTETVHITKTTTPPVSPLPDSTDATAPGESRRPTA